MKTIFYPDELTVNNAKLADDPLLILISYDAQTLILANIDDAFEHIILLRKVGFSDTDLDKYFRVVVNKSGADWTFVCPSEYKNMTDKIKRIETFFSDGIDTISQALKVIDYACEINIPQRYRRHLNLLSDMNGEK